MTNTVVRAVREDDGSWMVALNNAAMPAVSALAAPELAAYLAIAAWVRIAERDGRPAGFAAGFLPGAPYGSANYRWFGPRYADFLYIDRIVVHPDARGAGIGRRLYADAEHFARGRAGRLACEVNAHPPNPESMRFHEAWGFREVGRQDLDGGQKSVVLMIKALG